MISVIFSEFLRCFQKIHVIFWKIRIWDLCSGVYIYTLTRFCEICVNSILKMYDAFGNHYAISEYCKYDRFYKGVLMRILVTITMQSWRNSWFLPRTLPFMLINVTFWEEIKKCWNFLISSPNVTIYAYKRNVLGRNQEILEFIDFFPKRYVLKHKW